MAQKCRSVLKIDDLKDATRMAESGVRWWRRAGRASFRGTACPFRIR